MTRACRRYPAQGNPSLTSRHRENPSTAPPEGFGLRRFPAERTAKINEPRVNQGRKARANRVRGKAASGGLGYVQPPISAPPDPRRSSQPKGGLMRVPGEARPVGRGFAAHPLTDDGGPRLACGGVPAVLPAGASPPPG